MIDYISHRQNPLKKTSNDEINISLNTIADLFNINWLQNITIKNPLIDLWNRRDWLSTNELYLFGCHLRLLNTIDNNTWLKNQIKKIKSNDINSIKGSLFEINAIGFLIEKNKISPTKTNQPGYDAVLKYDDKIEFRISIKNFGLSRFQLDFNNQTEQFKQHIIGYLKYFKLNQIQLMIDFSIDIPQKKDWKIIEKKLAQLLKQFIDSNRTPISFNENGILIIISNISDKNYINSHLSFTFLASSVYHINEEKNIISKIEDACFNLAQHSNTNNELIQNILFIRLPSSASINNCFNWTVDYIKANPNKPISGIIYYQPTVAQSEDRTTTNLNHCFKLYLKESISNLISNKTIDIQIPVGTYSSEPSLLKIINEGIGEVTVDNRYITIIGEHFIEAIKEEDGSFSGNISAINFGVKKHLIFKESFDKELIITGIFPPDDELRII